jgi:DNA-binding response OmpR family regulator
MSTNREGETVPAAPMVTTQPLAGSRILVVEDDAVQALDLAASLAEAGAAVSGPVASLSEASNLALSTACDAAILDLRLRDRNATALARQLLQQGVPFIVHTGYPDSAFFRSDWPGYELVAKPTDIKQLIHRVAALIAWKRNAEAEAMRST